MKKTFKSFIAVAVAVAALVSCAKEVSNPVGENGVKLIKLTIVANNPEAQPTTRTEMNGTTPYWSVGDAIGVSNGTSTNYEFTTSITAAATTASFTGETEVSETLYAYYPYQDNGKETVGTANGTTGAKFDLPVVQTPTATSFDGAADVMVAKSFTVSGSTTTVEDLEFARLGAIVKIVLKDNDNVMSNQHPSSVSMTAASPLAGRFIIDMQNQCLSSIYYNASDIVTATYTTETKYLINNTNGTYLIVYPQTLASGTTLTITAATEDYSISKTITLSKDIVLLPGKVNTLNIGLAAGNIQSNASATPYSLYSGDLSEGDYVIVYDGVAMKATVSSDRLGYDNVTVTDNKIYDPSEDLVWHIAQSGDYWTIYNASVEKYAASTGAKNKAQLLGDGTDDKSLWTVTGESTYEFVNKQNTTNGVNANLRYNSGYGFACYAATTGGALSLYKLSDTRQDSGMSWSSNSATATITSTGITFTAPTLNIGHAYSVTYSSSTEAVATIDANGDVTIVGEGTTTISAAFAGDATYKPATVSYTLTVTDDRTACAAPTFTPGAGEVPSGTTVTIASTTPGAVIYYTTGSSDFSAGDWTEYTAPVAITAACTIKAIATATNYKNSEVTSAAYTLEAASSTIAEVLAGGAGSYKLANLLVYAVNGKNAIVGDATGKMLLFMDNTLSVGDNISIPSATVTLYSNTTLEITAGTITTNSAGNTVDHGTPLNLNDATVASSTYSTFSASGNHSAVYVSMTGAQSGQNITGANTTLHLNVANTATDGKNVNVAGYIYSWSSSYNNYNFHAISIEEDTTTPALSVTPKNLNWEATSTESKTITVTVNGSASGYSVSPASDSNWNISDDGNGTVTVSPKAANISTTDAKTLKLTITHDDQSSLSEEVTLTQSKAASQGFTPFNVWEDSFSNCESSSTALSSLSGSTSGFTGSYSGISTTYAMDGAIRVGKASGAGTITTPVLSTINGSSADLTVTFKAAGWNGKTAKITLSVNKGTVTEGQTTIASESTMSGTSPSMTGTTYTFHITGADATTAITFTTTNSIGIDDLVVTQTAN